MYIIQNCLICNVINSKSFTIWKMCLILTWKMPNIARQETNLHTYDRLVSRIAPLLPRPSVHVIYFSIFDICNLPLGFHASIKFSFAFWWQSCHYFPAFFFFFCANRNFDVDLLVCFNCLSIVLFIYFSEDEVDLKWECSIIINTKWVDNVVYNLFSM